MVTAKVHDEGIGKIYNCEWNLSSGFNIYLCYSCVSRDWLKKPGRQPMVPIIHAMNAMGLPFKHLKPILMTDDIDHLATCVHSASGQYSMHWNSFSPRCLNFSINLWHNWQFDLATLVKRDHCYYCESNEIVPFWLQFVLFDAFTDIPGYFIAHGFTQVVSIFYQIWVYKW